MSELLHYNTQNVQFSTKYHESFKKEEYDPYTQKNSQLIETIPEETQIFDLLDNKLFKSTILNLFKELKEIMYEELKETTGIISHQ